MSDHLTAEEALTIAAQHVINRDYLLAGIVAGRWGLSQELVYSRAREMQPALMALREANTQ